MMNAFHLQQFYLPFSSYNLAKAAQHSAGALTVPTPASTPQSNGVSFLSALSYDAVLVILSFLSVHDLGILAQVSRDAHHLAEDDFIWRQLCKGLEVKWSATLHRPLDKVPKIWARANEWKRAFHIELVRIAIVSRFVGLWSEKWCDVNVQHSTLIESDGRNWFVSYKKNKFVATFREFDAASDSLTFHLEGGDSGWSFIYKIKPTSDNKCQLSVFRLHDQKSFNGEFIRNELPEPLGVDNAMGTHV